MGEALSIQAFNWDFCFGKTYDILQSKAQTGILANTSLKRVDFKRTKHPIYSFSVYGKFQNDLTSLNNISAFGFNSPFNFMYKNHAKMIIVDLPLQDSFTFVYYVEEKMQVSYRYMKDFKAFYIDEFQNEELRTYSMYVRKENILTDINSLEDIFLYHNVMQKINFDGILIKIIDLNLAHNIIIDDIKNKQAKNLYRIKNDYTI